MSENNEKQDQFYRYLNRYVLPAAGAIALGVAGYATKQFAGVGAYSHGLGDAALAAAITSLTSAGIGFASAVMGGRLMGGAIGYDPDTELEQRDRRKKGHHALRATTLITGL